MHSKVFICASLLISLMTLSGGEPPFLGTIFLDPEIITQEDPSTFEELKDAGRGMRRMFDRRVNGWIQENAFLFEASFNDGLSIEVQVNPEHENVDLARQEAERYAPVIGQLPTALRKDVQTAWIHKGVQPFGGGNNNLLIHTGQAARYEKDGILEETLVHEASHTSLDATHARSAEWLEAQTKDTSFISTYARDNPNREDIAESFLLFLALEHRRDRISNELATTIENTIPHRLAYFRSKDFDLHPVTPRKPVALLNHQFDRARQLWHLEWIPTQGRQYELSISHDLKSWTSLVTIPSSQEDNGTWQQTKPLGQKAYFLQVR